MRHAAAELFLRNGYGGVSIDDIVRSVGGSKTTVYSQFQNKETLFVTVIEDLCDEFVAELMAVKVTDLPPEEGMSKLAEKLLRILLTPRHLSFWRLTVCESARIAGVRHAWFRHGPAAVGHFIAGLIRDYQGRGLMRDIDAEHAALLFHYMSARPLLDQAVLGEMPSDDEIQHAVSLAVDIFLHGARQCDTAARTEANPAGGPNAADV